jgi:hypothetical protein
MICDFETYQGSPPNNWDGIVHRLGGSIFHSTFWAEYQAKVQKVRPIFILSRDERGEACAVAVALFRQSSRKFLSWILRDISLTAHPCVRNDERNTAIEFVQRCEGLGRALRCSRITIESFMSGRSCFVPSEYGYLETGRLEFSLDLSKDIDSLWGNIRKDQREKIKRLKREGVAIEIGNTLEDLQGLRSAREATQAKRFLHGQGYELSGDDKFYESIHEYLIKRGVATLFVARQNGKVIAAIFFATFNRKAYSVFSGSTDIGYKLGAQGGLFWAAVETFKAEGFEELNRGGIPASAVDESDPLHGIYLFKLRLGTTPQMCRSGEKALSPLADRLTRLRDRLRTLRKTT